MRRVSFLSYALVVVLVTTLSGCTILKTGSPRLPRIFKPENVPTGKRPLIVVPGILGTRLRQKSGEVVWPARFGPAKASLSLPIADPSRPIENDELETDGIVEQAKFFRLGPEIQFYSELLTTLDRFGGYRRGDIDHPSADGYQDTFYVFAYDWRKDNVYSGRELARAIKRLKQTFHRPDLKFDIVSHSMGGLVSRYALMYGDADLPAQGQLTPDWSLARDVSRLFMFGTPNQGSLDALSTLINGYSVLGTNWPQLKLLSVLDADTVFTSPSVYQLLPHEGSRWLLDENLTPSGESLFEVETWRKYSWSVAFDASYKARETRNLHKEEKRLLKQKDPTAEDKLEALREKFEREQRAREPFLKSALARARRFHQALDVNTKLPPGLSYIVFGGDCEETLQSAVVRNIKGEWKTFFRVSRGLGNSHLRSIAAKEMFSPGDGRVTRQSLFGIPLDRQGKHGLSTLPTPAHAVFACEWHGDLPLASVLQDNLLTILFNNSF